jgi:hypothetical protein
MADARLDTRQLSEILLMLEQIVAAAERIRREIHQAMAARRRGASTAPTLPARRAQRPKPSARNQ